MIIRVLHEGQYEVEAQPLQRVDELDDQMLAAVVRGDEQAFRRLLDETLTIIRQQGRPLGVEDLRPSDVVLPASDSTLDEVRSLFAQEGLIGSA